jgi:hypothetical protein
MKRQQKQIQKQRKQELEKLEKELGILKENKKKKSSSWLKNAWSNAKDFIKKSAKKIKQNASKIIRTLKNETGTSKTKNTFKPGNLVAFQYDAKHKQNRYDKNPLAIILGPSQKTKGLYLGLNIHWMPMNERVALASFFVELLEKRNGELVYEDIKPFVKKFKGHPVLRSYYYNRVSKKVYEMDAEQYLLAAGLPTEKWMGGK